MNKTFLIQSAYGELYAIPNMPQINWLDDLPYDIEPELGKKYGVPGTRYQRRDICFLSNTIAAYKYSGYTAQAHSITDYPEIVDALMKINRDLGTHFNSVLINRYQDGSKYVGLHADGSRYSKSDHPVAKLVYGESRTFRVRRHGVIVKDYEMQDRDLLVMTGDFQQHYAQEIPKRSKVFNPCYVLTLFCCE